MPALVSAHRELAVAIVLLALAGSLWAGYVASRLRRSGRLPFLGSLATVAVALQALFGIVLAAAGQRPQDGLHFLFGPLTLLALPVARWAARDRAPRHGAVIVATGWLITLGLGLRAVGTGGGIA